MTPTEKAPGAILYVAPDGNDAWSGKLPQVNENQTDGPFATLERARDEIRKMKKAGPLPPGGVAVYLREGLYELSKTFELTKEDSGEPNAPIQYRSYPGEQARIIGGKIVEDFKPVTDSEVLNRLDESARGKVVQADLRAQGITDFGEVKEGGLELFYQNKPMTLARWPNEGFVKIVDILGKTVKDVRGTKGCVEGIFTYEGDRPKRWITEKDVWLHGYWFWDWADQRQKVEKIDTEKRVITLVPPHHHYGYRKGQWFYAFNILAEIDQPGEWYLDREKGILYFWPPAPIEYGQAMVSILPTLVSAKDASHIILRDLLLEAARGTAVIISGGEQNMVAACTLRNIGGLGISMSGKESRVVGCDLYQLGAGGISISGGDLKTLTPANLCAENNHIHHYGRWRPMYSAGIHLNGVGNRVAHNLIHNAPHCAMLFGGNDHVIEYNEIHSVCYESNDAGAIYAGRNWTMRGTVIRHNYLHHICGYEGRGCVGVYLDDMYCGTAIYGNVFYEVTMAAFIGGGRDCTIENNIFVDCRPAVHVDSRALGWAHACAENWVKEAREKGTLSGVKYKEPPYSVKYPQLINIIEDDPAAPKGNVIARNICVGGKWDHIDSKARPLVKMEDNLVDQDPKFVDGALPPPLRFQLKNDSPAYKLGFKRIPIEKIGLYKDVLRASWPVKHMVRPMPTPPVKARATRPGPKAVFNVPRGAPVPTLDTIATADKKNALIIEQGIQHEILSPKSYAWLSHDGQNLYVAVLNDVDTQKPLRMGGVWGRDDAVEVALRNPAVGKTAPIYVLRGYPNGKFESSTESGIPEALARKAGQAVKFSAKVLDQGHWAAVYQIPLAVLEIDPAKHTKLEFNISLRKTAQPIWLMWQGTFACTWEVGNAGFIVLQ